MTGFCKERPRSNVPLGGGVHQDEFPMRFESGCFLLVEVHQSDNAKPLDCSVAAAAS